MGWCGWASLLPISAYGLWLIGVGTEPSDGRYSVPLHRMSQHYFRPPFQGVQSPPRWAIWYGVDRSDPWWTKSVMEKPAFTRVSLSNVRVIMMIMCVPVVELICQAVMKWIPVLKYLLCGACGHLWPRPIVPCIKCHRFLRFWLRWCLPSTEKNLNTATEGPGVSWARGMGQTGLTGGKFFPTHGFQGGGKCCCGSLLGLVIFRFVVPPLQLGVIGPYLIWGTWFSNRLPLEGTDRIQIFRS
jgi:hypothetical protein